jgi:hypothetical protein
VVTKCTALLITGTFTTQNAKKSSTLVRLFQNRFFFNQLSLAVTSQKICGDKSLQKYLFVCRTVFEILNCFDDIQRLLSLKK